MAIVVMAIPVVAMASDYAVEDDYQGYNGYHRYHRHNHRHNRHNMDRRNRMMYRDCCYYFEDNVNSENFENDQYKDSKTEGLPRNDRNRDYRRHENGQYSDYYRHHRGYRN